MITLNTNFVLSEDGLLTVRELFTPSVKEKRMIMLPNLEASNQSVPDFLRQLIADGKTDLPKLTRRLGVDAEALDAALSRDLVYPFVALAVKREFQFPPQKELLDLPENELKKLAKFGRIWG